jgi:hypothetical protein
VLFEKIDLALIKPEILEHFLAAQILLGVTLSADVADKIVTPPIRFERKAELLRVGTPEFVTGLGALFRTEIGVQAVWERIMRGPDVTAGARRSFQDCYIVAAPDQLVCTAQSADAAAGYNDMFPPSGWFGSLERHRGQNGPARQLNCVST